MSIRHVLFICSRNQLRSPTAEQEAFPRKHQESEDRRAEDYG